MVDLSTRSAGADRCRPVRVGGAEIPMRQEWCPVQAAICLAYRQWQPYWEPLRALPLPEPDWVQGCLCVGLVEERLIRVLDDAGGIDGAVLRVQWALQRLDQGDKELIATLAAYQDSDGQFDFGRAAHAWTAAKRGIMPVHTGSIGFVFDAYNAWVKSKAKKRAQLEGRWMRLCFPWIGQDVAILQVSCRFWLTLKGNNC